MYKYMNLTLTFVGRWSGPSVHWCVGIRHQTSLSWETNIILNYWSGVLGNGDILSELISLKMVPIFFSIFRYVLLYNDVVIN